MADSFVAAVARGLAALSPPSRLVVAVSGGADSVALLEALARARKRREFKAIELVVGHVDHRLRAGSQADGALVARHAARLGLPFELRTLALAGRRNLEEAARHARYEALHDVARAHRARAIVTAHTATDQAETLLLRLLRGAGAHGLAGMAPARPADGLAILRPMLGLTREATRAFCARETLEFSDDPSNVDERPRARLRAEVLPVLERLAPGAVLRLAAAADRLREDDAFLEREAVRAAAGAALASLALLPTALRRRALVLWFEGLSGSRRRLTSRHLEALEALVLTGRGEVELPASAATRRVAQAIDGRLRVFERARPESVTGRSGRRRLGRGE